MKDKPDGPDVEVLPVGASAGASAGVADADTEGWISSLGRKTGGWMEDNPAKSTLILTITGGIIKEKVVDRALSWVWVWGKGLFARGAEQKLDEAIASESGDAVANATGMGLGIGVLKLLGGLFKVAP